MSIQGCANLTQIFKKEILNSFTENFLDGRNKWFIGIANPIPWSHPREDENPYVSPRIIGSVQDTPPPNLDNEEEKYRIHKRLIGIKKVEFKNLVFMIPKNQWVSGRIYDPYRHDEDMFDESLKNFYIFNEEDNGIYKCIENNNDSPSTILPVASESDYTKTFTTSDGYRWRLICRISPVDNLNFFILGRDESGDFVPVRFIDYDPDPSSVAEFQQKQIQENSISGEISSIYIDSQFRNTVKYDNRFVAFGQNSLQIIDDIGPTGFRVSSWPGFINNANALSGMMLRTIKKNPEDSGVTGADNIREIVSNTTISSGNIEIFFDSELKASEKLNIDLDKLEIEILPKVTVYGDGSSNNAVNLKYDDLKSAIGFPQFDDNGILVGVDLLDSGKEYSHAQARIVKGITASSPSFAEDFEIIRKNLLRVSLSPQGGHGSNAITELGARRILLKGKFDDDDRSIIFPKNDFRQIALIKNPELQDPIYAIRTNDVLGSTGQVIGNSNYSGKILSMSSFKDGYYEFLVQSISGNKESFLDLADSRYSDSFRVVTGAGDEVLREHRLIFTDITGGTRSTVGPLTSDVRSLIVGLGSTSSGINPSFAVARIRDYTANGLFFVEGMKGRFIENENVVALSPTGNYPLFSFKISEISDPLLSRVKTTYDMTTRLILSSEENKEFSFNTFERSQMIYSFEDSKTTQFPPNTVDYKSSAFIYASTIVSEPVIGLPGNTNQAIVEVLGVKRGSFSVGDKVLYRFDKSSVNYATINTVIEPEIKYGSGEVINVQNFSGIERDVGISEEINLVIGL